MDFRFTLSHTPKQSITSGIDLPDNSEGENVGPVEDGGLPNIQEWTVGALPTVNLPGEGIIAATQTSRIYAIDYTFATGLQYTINYSLEYDIGANTSDRTLEFVVLDGGDNVLVSDEKALGTGVATLNSSSTFTAPSGAVKYGFRVELTNTAPNVGGSDFEIQNNVTGSVTTVPEPGNPTSLQITEPDGWKQCKLKLERHDDFHSLIEYYEGGAGGAFIFFGNNGQENGGIDFLRDIEQIYGFDASISILTEFSFDGINYEEIFSGQVDVSAKDEMVDNLMQAPVIRDDFWTKFINRRSTQIDLSSNVDLDGKPVEPAMPVTVNLPSQKIKKEYSGTLSEGKAIYENDILINEYIQYDFDNEILSEIDEKYNLFIASNPEIPVDLIEVKEAGTYDIDLRIEMSIKNHGGGAISACAGAFTTDPTSAYIDVFVRINKDDTEASSTDFIGQSTVYTYSGSVDLNVGDQIRIYAKVTSVAWKLSNSVDSILIYGDDNSTVSINTGNFTFNGTSCVLSSVELEDRSFSVPSGASVPTYLTVSANTVYSETTAQGFLIHDLFYAVLQRMGLGQDPLYSEFLGSTLTNYRQYASDGCGWMYVILKGLQIRQYTLSEKPFFISFNQIWEGIHPILCLGLSYEEMDDSPGAKVIRIEQMDHFFSDEVSINFSNVRDIHSYYDNERIFKTVKTGYKKWQSEDISGIDDPQTKRTYALRFERVGKDLPIESDFIAAGTAIEKTRRTTIEKSADYKYDNDNFIIALNPNDVSPDRYVPELDENFDQIAGLLNSDTRYNLILTPMRNLLRWAKFLGGCLQPYNTSAYRFVSGEGNYNMLTDYSCTNGRQCQAIICDPLSERQDISLSDYNSVFGYLHLSQECDMTIPMTKDQYDVIKNNKNKSIGISQTDSNFTKFKIKLLEYDLIQGQATIKAWPKTYFNIQVINDPIEMPDCSSSEPPPCCDYDCFNVDYRAILDYATLQGYTPPSFAQQCIQNQLVVDLKSAGAWDQLDVLYVFATDGSEDFAKINWINPGTFTQVETGTVSFTPNAGFQGNGTNGYLNNGYIPSTHAVNYLANDASAFCYINNNVLGTTFDFGVNDAINQPSTILISRAVGDIYTWRINFAPQQGGANNNSMGFHHLQKRATDARILKNGAQVGSAVTITATGVPSRFMPLFANNNNGSIGGYSNRQMGFFGMGASLEGNESALYTAWNDYFTSL